MTQMTINQPSIYFTIKVNLQKFRQKDMTKFISQSLKYIKSKNIKREFWSHRTRFCLMKKYCSFLNHTKKILKNSEFVKIFLSHKRMEYKKHRLVWQ